MVARRVACGALLLCLFYYSHTFPPFRNPNEFSRLYLVRALAEEGRFEITTFRERFGAVQDEASRGGRYYSDKAPGLALAATPLLALLRTLFRAVDFTPSNHQLRHLLSLLLLTVPTAILLFALRAFWARWTGDGAASDAALVAYGLGSLALPYAGLFYGHQLVALLLTWSFLLLWRARGGEGGFWKFAAAGFLAGYAFLTEYPALVAGGLLFTYLGLTRRRPGPLLAFALGALPAVALVFLYNWRLFGGPLEFPYRHEVQTEFFRVHREGFLGFSLPGGGALAGLLFGPERGVFFQMPVMLLGFLGILSLPGKGHRAECFLFAGLFVAYLVLLSSFPLWKGGWAIGPRHFTPLMPFLATGLAWALARGGRAARWAGASLLVPSVAMVASQTAVFPYPQEIFVNPPFEMAFPLLVGGPWSASLGKLLGLPGWVSLLPFALGCALATGWAIGRVLPGWKARLSSLLAGLLLLGLLSLPRGKDALGQEVARVQVAHLMGEEERAFSRLAELRDRGLPEGALRRYLPLRQMLDELGARERARREGGIRLRQLVVRSRSVAERVLRQLRLGADFATLAREFSVDSTARSGGELGYVRRGELREGLEQVLFGLKVGAVSPIVESPAGFYIFQRTF